jgi:3-oxoacyl-ACP reductase-like protein
MAQKTDFTEQEWEQLRKGATGAGMLVAVSDRSFFDSFKEAGSLAKHVAGGRSHQNELIKALSSERGTGFELTARPDEVESETLEALRSSVATLEQKAPEDVEAYRSFVLEVAEAVGKAAGGGDEVEAATIAKVKSALA